MLPRSQSLANMVTIEWYPGHKVQQISTILIVTQEMSYKKIGAFATECYMESCKIISALFIVTQDIESFKIISLLFNVTQHMESCKVISALFNVTQDIESCKNMCAYLAESSCKIIARNMIELCHLFSIKTASLKKSKSCIHNYTSHTQYYVCMWIPNRYLHQRVRRIPPYLADIVAYMWSSLQKQLCYEILYSYKYRYMGATYFSSKQVTTYVHTQVSTLSIQRK